MRKRAAGWNRWLAVRLHRETGRRPYDAFQQEKPSLQPLPLAGYDISCSRRVRATNRCRIALESNRYTVPFEHAGAVLELRIEPETLTLYRGQKLIAQHPRSYGRNQDIENPDHLSRLATRNQSSTYSACGINPLGSSRTASPPSDKKVTG